VTSIDCFSTSGTLDERIIKKVMADFGGLTSTVAGGTLNYFFAKKTARNHP